jgi:formylglycine-generating enzyme required for sulfatase activity
MRSLGLVLIGVCLLQSIKAQPYSLPEAIKPMYYFKPGDSVMPADVPSKSLLKWLKDFRYIQVDSFTTERADGYDSIVGLYGPDYKIKHRGFFYSPTEVSNAEYKRFEHSSKQAENRPDTNCWLGAFYYSEPLAAYYYQHPAYASFPVCGISYIQAKRYCNWLQDSLNHNLQKKGILERVKVDLPSSDEWLCIYYDAIKKQRKKTKKPISRASYLEYSLPESKPGVVSGVLYTSRFAELQSYSKLAFATTPVNGVMPIGGVYHIMGNIAEWTSTSAQGHLFNNKEYIYTVTGRIAPNVYETHDSVSMQKYLRGKQLEPMMVVKGGSWLDEHYYLQPGAQYLMDAHKNSCKVGFRPIIRVVKP